MNTTDGANKLTKLRGLRSNAEQTDEVSTRQENEMKNDAQRIAVIGASRGTGREVARALLDRGHHVTAFARSAPELPNSPRLRVHRGDVLNLQDIEACVAGHDAVIVTLGIHENAMRVRLGLQSTPIDVRSRGTANVIAAMAASGARRLVVQTTYGIGDTKGRLPLGWSLIFSLLLAPQIADSERQEAIVRQSPLDWTLVQPVGLTDKSVDRQVFSSTSGETKSMQVSRAQVAHVLCDAATSRHFVHDSVAVSA